MKKKLFGILASAGLLVGCDQAGQGGGTDTSDSSPYGSGASSSTTTTDPGAYGSGATSGSLNAGASTNNLDTGTTGSPETLDSGTAPSGLGNEGVSPDPNTNSGTLSPGSSENPTR